MRVLCVWGQYNYGDPNRGEGYEYANFTPALRRLGHEILFFDNWDRTRYRSFADLNQALLETVEQHRPDVVLAVQIHFEIWLETWQILRDSGIAATINWATDDSWRYSQFSRFVAPHLHAFATTYPSMLARYHQDGIHNVVLTQWAANASLQPPLPAAQCQFPVSFVGTAHGNRRRSIAALRERGIEVACFGHGWPNGPVAADEIPRIMRQSVISLNFANSVLAWDGIGGIRPRRMNQVKARTFEVPGDGGFLLTEWAEGLERYYNPGDEIAVFHNLDELADQIRYYLAHPDERDAIARGGYQRTCSEHTYDRRMNQVLDFAISQKEHCSERQSAGQINWQSFAEAKRRHQMTKSLYLLRQGLLRPCSIVWGARGPRAARRLVFEMSWRLLGAHTYSAAGLPGRMFYQAS